MCLAKFTATNIQQEHKCCCCCSWYYRSSIAKRKGIKIIYAKISTTHLKSNPPYLLKLTPLFPQDKRIDVDKLFWFYRQMKNRKRNKFVMKNNFQFESIQIFKDYIYFLIVLYPLVCCHSFTRHYTDNQSLQP